MSVRTVARKKKKKFITNKSDRLMAKSNAELFSFIKTWNIDLTYENFQSRLQGYYDVFSIIDDLTEHIDSSLTHIEDNLHEIIIILWNRLTPDKILLENMIRKVIAADGDVSETIVLWDEFVGLINHKDFNLEIFNELLDSYEFVRWLDNCLFYIFQQILASGGLDLYHKIFGGFEYVKWPENHLRYLIRIFLIEVALLFVFEGEEKSEIGLDFLLEIYPGLVTEIHADYANMLSGALDAEGLDMKTELEHKISEHLDISRSYTNNEQMLDYIDSIDQDAMGEDTAESEEVAEQKFVDDLFSNLDDVISKLEKVSIELICYNCGLNYKTQTSRLLIDQNLLNDNNISKISDTPDNGRVLFPYEVRCPTCNGFEYILELEAKTLVILPMMANKDNKLRVLNVVSNRSRSKTGNTDIMSWLIREYKKDRKNLDIIFRLANTFRKMNDFDRAKKFYLKAQKLDKTNPDIYFNLGEIYLCRNDLKRAEYCFKMVHKYDKRSIKRIKKEKEVFKETRAFVSNIKF